MHTIHCLSKVNICFMVPIKRLISSIRNSSYTHPLVTSSMHFITLLTWCQPDPQAHVAQYRWIRNPITCVFCRFTLLVYVLGPPVCGPGPFTMMYKCITVSDVQSQYARAWKSLSYICNYTKYRNTQNIEIRQEILGFSMPIFRVNCKARISYVYPDFKWLAQCIIWDEIWALANSKTLTINSSAGKST